MIHIPMSPMKCRNTLFIAVLGVLFLILCLAVAFGQVPLVSSGEHNHKGSGAHRHSHEVNMKGYDELRESVLIRMIKGLRAEVEALEERVTTLEEK